MLVILQLVGLMLTLVKHKADTTSIAQSLTQIPSPLQTHDIGVPLQQATEGHGLSRSSSSCWSQLPRAKPKLANPWKKDNPNLVDGMQAVKCGRSCDAP